MKKADFDFQLPSELIAQAPLPERSESRLLQLNKKSGAVTDLVFKDILQQLHAGDLLVFNNTKVIPARLLGNKTTGGQVEVFIERLLNDTQAKVMIKANKALKLGAKVQFDGVSQLLVTARQGMFYLIETLTHETLPQLMNRVGHMPLPPYINREANSQDDERYQTVYADDKQAGAVAAPTAGLHFDEELLDALEEKGIRTAFVTLHVGAGTFQPVKAENLADHHMHKEWLSVDQSVCDLVSSTQNNGHRVVAVGTTAVRCLETAAADGQIKPYVGDTQIFIYPGHQFNAIDGLITNFHLPESTLVMLVSALAGRESILAAYQHAVDECYRFFSYGDAMLII